MPINLKDELKRKKSDTDKLLSGLEGQTAANLAQLRSGIGSRTNQFMSAVNPALSAYGINPTAGGANFSRSLLSRELNRSLAPRVLESKRNALNLRYGNLDRRADKGLQDLNTSVDYSRMLEDDVIRRNFEAEQQASNIEASRKKEEIADEYSKRGVALQDQYKPDMSYEGAVIRALFGLGGSLATGLTIGALNKNKAQATRTEIPFGKTELPYGPAFNQGYYPRPLSSLSGGFQGGV